MSASMAERWASGWRGLLLRLPVGWRLTLAEGWRQCLAVLPSGLGQLLREGRLQLVLIPDGEHWQLFAAEGRQLLDRWPDRLPAVLQRQHVLAAMQGVAVEDRRLWLGLPAGCSLVRELQLPTAARHSLVRIARFEMDRQTPFRTEQVYFDIREVPAATGSSSLQARLAVAPRARLDGRLAPLAELGLALDGVDLVEADGLAGFNLLPPPRRPVHPRPRRRLNVRLGLCLLALLLAVAGQWRHNRHLALLDMRAAVAAQQLPLRQLAGLQRDGLERGRAAGFLERRRRETVPVVQVLAELSQRLPDDTSLQRLSIDADGRLSFLGLAPQAAHLVDVLKAAGDLGEPGFQGTILRDPLSGKERFSMTAQLHRPTLESRP